MVLKVAAAVTASNQKPGSPAHRGEAGSPRRADASGNQGDARADRSSASDRPLASRNSGADPVPRLYPEVRAGGFTRNDHRVIFFARVNALLRSEMTVLDFGAGRGIWAEIESGFKLDLTTLKGKCRKVVGADLDPIVLDNPLIDEAIVLPDDGAIPLPDRSIEMIVSWAVFEHLSDPARTAAELDRVLRPGGWICAWTPNKWSYVSVGDLLPWGSLG